MADRVPGPQESGKPGTGKERWQDLTRRVGAFVRVRTVPTDGVAKPIANALSPQGKRRDVRKLLERLPAPRGQDALHERSQISHLFSWLLDDEAAVHRTLAQRASEVLAGLGPLQLPARQVGDGLPGGLHRSLRRGGGVEFSEHKEYAPGDELRQLDWKALARTDRYYVKRFEQEVHATLTLVVDASASMQLVDHESDKFDAVRLMLACIALVLVRQGDSVGLVVLGQPALTVTPGTGLRHFANLAERLERVVPEGTASLGALGPSAWRHMDRRGLVLVASDALLPPDQAVPPLVTLRRSGLDVLLLHTLHPRELDLGFAAPAQFTCRETDRRRTIDPRVIRATYVDLMAAHCDALRQVATHNGVGYLLVNTAVDPRGLIRQILRSTARLKRSGSAGTDTGAYAESTYDVQSVLAEEGGEGGA